MPTTYWKMIDVSYDYNLSARVAVRCCEANDTASALMMFDLAPDKDVFCNELGRINAEHFIAGSTVNPSAVAALLKFALSLSQHRG